MKKIIIIITMILFSNLISYSSEVKNEEISYGKINTKEDKIKNIDEKILELSKEIEYLNTFRKKVEESEIDIRKKNKPCKIALVLSGGGAKGASHIGVLKTLEKYNVPVDIIIGTSAGSIIGGLYSIGYTPEEIEEFLKSLDFKELFISEKSRNLKSISEKIESSEKVIKLSIDENNKIRLPQGLTSGQLIYLKLKKAFEKTEGIKDFDKLPIKYRAVTTDINTGSQRVIGNGDLAKATFMSMAIPSVLNPVYDDGSYFVDGGVVNNFPVKEAIDMGADIVIAVDITADAEKISDGSNIVNVLDKISGYNGIKNTEEQKRYADILITPNVKNINTLDFSKIDKIIEEGSIASENISHILKNLSDKNKFLAKKNEFRKLEKKSFKINNIIVENASMLKEEEIEDTRPSKEEMTIEDLNEWAKKLYAKSYIEKIFYDVDGDDIKFSVKEDPNYNIKSGIGFKDRDYGGFLNLEADFIELGSLVKDYYLNVELSKYYKIILSKTNYRRKNKFKYFDEVKLSFDNEPIFLNSKDGDLLSTYNNKIFKLEYGVSSVINKNSIFKIGINYKNVGRNYDGGNRYSFVNDNIKNFLGATAYILSDSLDSVNFSTEGGSYYISGFYDADTNKLEDNIRGYKYSLLKAFKINEELIFHPFMSGGKIYKDEKRYSYDDLFKIGGIQRLTRYIKNIGFYGLPYSGMVTDEVLVGGLNIQYLLKPNLYFNMRYNAMTYNSDKFYYQEDFKYLENYKNGYGIGLGWDTLFGPIEASITNNIFNSEVLFNIYFGYTF